MMSNLIQFGEPIEFQLPQEKLPPDNLLIARSENQAQRREYFQVYILERAFNHIRRHVAENPNLECGGILVGYPFHNLDDPAMTFVIIVAGIRQDSADRSRGHFTIGPAEIAAARLEMEEEYQGLTVVGWYHSHPGHGVFLSGQDMQIVTSIYNAPWHLALVIDPQREETAFFRGAEGERLPTWLELCKKPMSIEAIALYNRAIETDRLEDFRKWLFDIDSHPELQHWRQQKRYQDLNLESEPLFLSRRRSVAGAEDRPSRIENKDIERMYQKAIRDQEANSMAAALRTFETIQAKVSHYKDVDHRIAEIKRKSR